MHIDLRIAVLVFASLAPPLMLLRWIYKSDYYPEPRTGVFLSFLLGALTLIPIRAIGSLHGWIRPEIQDPVLSALYTASLVAAAPEELCKFLVLWFYSVRRASFDEPMDGVVHGAAVSLGFALQENVFRVIEGDIYVAVARGLTAVPAHACFGAIMGYHVGLRQLGLRSGRSAAMGLLAALTLHTAFDFPLMCLRNLNHEPWFATLPSIELVGRYGLSTLFVFILTLECSWTYSLVKRLRIAQVAASRAASTDSEIAGNGEEASR